MNLLDIITPECICAPLKSTDKQGVIDELVDCLAAQGRVSNAKALKEAVWAREQTRTTGIGQGLAIPHGKSPGMKELAMAIGKPAEPLDFESLDGEPVRLVVLLASPPDRTSDHIHALARVSRLISMESVRNKMYEATTPQEIYELISSQEKSG